MKVSRRIAVIAAREISRFVAVVAERAAQAESRGSPSFRPLTEAEIEAILGGDLLAALSGARRRARS
jgi:hypothetical protein